MPIYAIVLLSLYGLYLLWALIYVCYIYKKLAFLKSPEITSNSKYPGFNRIDYQYWNRFHFFIGTAILLPIRISLLIALVLPIFLVIRLSSLICCVDTSGRGPRKGCIIAFITKFIQWASRLCLFIMGFYWITFKKKKPNPENLEGLDDYGNWPQAILIGNHVTYTEAFYHIFRGPNSFIAGQEAKNFPMFGFIIRVIQFIFVNTKDKESRSKTFELMEERIDNIGKNPSGYNQLALFPEAATNNGRGLLKFKRGAFSLNTPVKIMFHQYKYDFVNPSITYISVKDIIFLNLIQYRQRLTVTELEGTYYPTNFTDWEDFAERIRNLMGKEFNQELMDVGKKDKDVVEKEFTPDWYDV